MSATNFAKIEELNKAVKDFADNLDKINKAKTIQEVNDLEKASSTLLPIIQRVVMECSWDLKRSVLQRRAEIATEQDKELDKELGL